MSARIGDFLGQEFLAYNVLGLRGRAMIACLCVHIPFFSCPRLTRFFFGGRDDVNLRFSNKNFTLTSSVVDGTKMF